MGAACSAAHSVRMLEPIDPTVAAKQSAERPVKLAWTDRDAEPPHTGRAPAHAGAEETPSTPSVHSVCTLTESTTSRLQRASLSSSSLGSISIGFRPHAGSVHPLVETPTSVEGVPIWENFKPSTSNVTPTSLPPLLLPLSSVPVASTATAARRRRSDSNSGARTPSTSTPATVFEDTPLSVELPPLPSAPRPARRGIHASAPGPRLTMPNLSLSPFPEGASSAPPTVVTANAETMRHLPPIKTPTDSQPSFWPWTEVKRDVLVHHAHSSPFARHSFAGDHPDWTLNLKTPNACASLKPCSPDTHASTTSISGDDNDTSCTTCTTIDSPLIAQRHLGASISPDCLEVESTSISSSMMSDNPVKTPQTTRAQYVHGDPTLGVSISSPSSSCSRLGLHAIPIAPIISDESNHSNGGSGDGGGGSTMGLYSRRLADSGVRLGSACSVYSLRSSACSSSTPVSSPASLRA